MTEQIPSPGAVYAKILRAAMRGRGVRLSEDECGALLFDHAALYAAVGGDDGDLPPWLTATEQRRAAWALDALAPGLLDPKDDRRLPDGSRFVDVCALAAVVRHLSGVTP